MRVYLFFSRFSHGFILDGFADHQDSAVDCIQLAGHQSPPQRFPQPRFDKLCQSSQQTARQSLIDALGGQRCRKPVDLPRGLLNQGHSEGRLTLHLLDDNRRNLGELGGIGLIGPDHQSVQVAIKVGVNGFQK